jgi:hypothetical protein
VCDRARSGKSVSSPKAVPRACVRKKRTLASACVRACDVAGGRAEMKMETEKKKKKNGKIIRHMFERRSVRADTCTEQCNNEENKDGGMITGRACGTVDE